MVGRALGGRAVFAVGYTGLGVATGRFGALVALDHAEGRTTGRTRLELVRTRPIPFSARAVPLAGITLTRRALAKADRRDGRHGPGCACSTDSVWASKADTDRWLISPGPPG
jgi:hypothetical protein